MDVAAMRRDGIDVFIHKASDGNRFYRDPYFGEAMRRARSAGMPVTGAYHVLWNGNVTGQVDWFIDTVLAAAPWAATEPFEWMWDCEPFGYNGGAPSTATINAACDRLMQRLPNHRPLAYCPRWAYGDLSGMRCPVVASSYGTNPAVGYRQAYPGDGSSRWGTYGGVDAPIVLQYGSTTTVGSQPTVDANAYRGTVDQFRALITGADMALADDDIRRIWEYLTPNPNGGQLTFMRDFVTYGNNVAWANSGKIDALAAADATRDKAMLAAIQALAAGGTSVDTAAVVTAVNAVRDEARGEFGKLHAENADLKTQVTAKDAAIASLEAKLAAAAQAQADAFKAA
jgi:hypothetical protein